MDASKYRQVMTDLFFRGEMPEEEPPPQRTTGSGGQRGAPRSPGKSKIDELRALNQQIAALSGPAE